MAMGGFEKVPDLGRGQDPRGFVVEGGGIGGENRVIQAITTPDAPGEEGPKVRSVAFPGGGPVSVFPRNYSTASTLTVPTESLPRFVMKRRSVRSSFWRYFGRHPCPRFASRNRSTA